MTTADRPPIPRQRRPLSPSQAALRTRPFMIGDWLIEPIHGRLRHTDGRDREVDADTMMVLVLLTTNAGQITARDEILATIWPEVEDDEPLEAAVARLRERLDDDPDEPGVIEAAGEGYRLVSRVKLLANDSGHWRIDPGTGELVAEDEGGTGRKWVWLAVAAVLILLVLALGVYLGP